MSSAQVSLKAVTTANFRQCVKLKVAEGQAGWVAPNDYSLAQAYVNPKLTPLAIYDGELITRDPAPEDRMVGFVMYQVWDEVGFIMRLMIGAEFQRRGYARATMEEVIRRLRMIPQVRHIGTSVVPENEAATQLYLGLGFVDSKWAPEDPAGERYLMLDFPGVTSVSGTVLYFSYGSNMLTARLQARTPSARPVGPAHVDGRRLVFHKLSTDGSGKCDLVEAPGRAHGVLYRIATEQIADLDRVEGVGHGYRKETITVVPAAGPQKALMYLADLTREGLRPFRWYKAFVVAGAVEHRLPRPYVDALRTVTAIADPDAARRAHNNAILLGVPVPPYSPGRRARASW